jgi:hypothetical protein
MDRIWGDGWPYYQAEAPAIEDDEWGFLIPVDLSTGNAVTPGGNCMGLTTGEYGVTGTGDMIRGVAPEFLRQRNLNPGTQYALDYINGEVDAGRLSRNELDDLAMERWFGATRTEVEAEATFALYGAHIALKLQPSVDMWLSRGSIEKPLIVHRTAAQLSHPSGDGKLGMGLLQGFFKAGIQPRHIVMVDG